MVNYVNTETNTCIFGYGAIHVSVLGCILKFREIKPPVGNGNLLINEDGEKVGDWDYTGNQISILFHTLDEIETICDHIKYIEENKKGSFTFKDITFDFMKYTEESMNAFKKDIITLKNQMLLCMAC